MICCTSIGVGPDVLEEHVVALGVGAERLGLEVEVHRPGQRVGDDQRRAGEVVHLHVGADPALEVAVAGEHRGDGEVVLVDRGGDLVDQRAGVADADRAAVADGVEAEPLEVLVETGLLVVVGDDLRARAERGLDPRLLLQAACSRALRARSPAASMTDGFDVLVHEVIAASVTAPLSRMYFCPSGVLTLTGLDAAFGEPEVSDRDLVGLDLFAGDGSGIRGGEGSGVVDVDRAGDVVQEVLLELRLRLGQQDPVLRALRAGDRGDDRGQVELEVLAEVRLARRRRARASAPWRTPRRGPRPARRDR